MNWTTLQGNWNETKGKVKSKWGRLTDDDLTQVQGQKDRLVGVIQQKYGIARDKAEEQLEEFLVERRRLSQPGQGNGPRRCQSRQGDGSGCRGAGTGIRRQRS